MACSHDRLKKLVYHQIDPAGATRVAVWWICDSDHSGSRSVLGNLTSRYLPSFIFQDTPFSLNFLVLENKGWKTPKVYNCVLSVTTTTRVWDLSSVALLYVLGKMTEISRFLFDNNYSMLAWRQQSGPRFSVPCLRYKVVWAWWLLEVVPCAFHPL